MHQKKLLTTALVASTIAGIGIVPAQNAEAASISSFVSNALAIANDNSHGYSMVNRWGPDYDCSSFVITCLKQAGFETGGATYSGSMVSNLTQHGFSYIPSSKIDLSSSSSLQAGDILMASGHTEIYIGNGKRVGAHLNYDGKTGDSGGNEISVLDYSRGSWYGILRYTGSGSTATAVTTAATTTASGQSGTYKVNANLNLRSGNSTSTSILITIPKGTSVTVSQVSNGWGKTTYGGKTGWIYLSYATQTGSTASTASASTPAATTTAAAATATTTTAAGTTYKTTANLNVRSGNSTSTSILTSIPKGTSVTVTEVKNNWGKTSYGGKTGWISLDYATKTGGTTTAAAAATAAKTTTTATASVAGTVYKTNGNMYLRSSNNKTASVLGVIPKGTSVTATQISNNWGKIAYGGKTGWMSLKYSTKTGTVSAPAATTAKATTTSTASATVAGTTSKTTSFIYQVTSNLNLRSGNSTSYAKLGVVPRGTAVTVTEVKNNWGKISYGGKTGWVSLQYASKKGSNVVTTINTVVKNAASSTTKAVTYTYMTTANLNLRKSYSTASAKILTMPNGTSLTVTEIKNNWGKVNYKGNVGWMSLQYAICTGSQTTVKNIIGETSAAPTLKTASVPATTSAAKTASVAATTPAVKTASVAATTPAVKTASVAASASAVKLTASAAPVTLASTAEAASVTDTEKANESTEAVETKPAAFSMPVSVVNAFEDEEKTEEAAAEEAAVEATAEEAAVEATAEEAAVEATAEEETVVEESEAEETEAEEAAAEETAAEEATAEEAAVEDAVTEEAAEDAAEEEAVAEEVAEETAEEETVAEEAEAEDAEEAAEEAADAFETGNYAAQKEIRIFADASEGAAVLTTFEAGTVLEVTAENDGWGKVSIEGQTCWIRLSECEKTDGAVTQGLTLASESPDEESVEAEDANTGEQAGEAEDTNAGEQAGEDESGPEMTEDQTE